MTVKEGAYERLKYLIVDLDSVDETWLGDGRLLRWKETARWALRRMCPPGNELERRLSMLEEVYFSPSVMEPSSEESRRAAKRGAQEAKAILTAAMCEYEFEASTEPDLESVGEVKSLGRDIFIVHGHDNEMRETVARFLQEKNFSVTILHEKPSGGATIIEKLENYSEVDFAVVLFSPDDVGASKGASGRELRARQNVIYELGLFSGKLGRNRVCVIRREAVEIPSDFHGVNYIDFDTGGGWKQKLIDELKHVGFTV